MTGPRAQELAAKARGRKDFHLNLTDEFSVSMTICNKSCESPVAQPHSSMAAGIAGGIVAALVIVAMVTVGLLITVILVKYR